MDVLARGKVSGTGSYSSGGSTSTTLGVEAKSISGSWSTSGTSTISSGSGTGFSQSGLKDKRLFGQFMYRQYISPYCQTLNKPYSYYGKGNTVSIRHPTFPNCGGLYGVNGVYTHTSSTNQTYSSGLTVFGVGLSSHAGYSSTASLSFKFVTPGRVCGNNADLGETSPIVEAHTV